MRCFCRRGGRRASLRHICLILSVSAAVVLAVALAVAPAAVVAAVVVVDTNGHRHHPRHASEGSIERVAVRMHTHRLRRSGGH